MEKCPYHDDLAKDVSMISRAMPLLQKDMEYLRRDVESILSRFCKHVEDAEKAGGRHDRLNKAEVDIEQIKTDRRNDNIMGRWFMIGSGVIGGLIVSGAINAVDIVRKFLVG